MHSADYLDWSQVSGLSIRNYSTLDRYRAYQPLISSSGLNVIIVAEFLRDNGDELNPAQWRSSKVYEMFEQLEQRLEITAAALNAIGATRTAAIVAKTKMPLSPNFLVMEIGPRTPENLAKATALAEERAKEWALSCESRTEIVSLLDCYTATHSADLKADLARHGDPRQQPGYSREKRLADLEALRRREFIKESQAEKSRELTEATRDLEKKLAKAGTDPKALKRIGSKRGEYRKLMRECLEIALEDRTPETMAALGAAETFVKANAAFFNPPLTQDAELNARLAALGKFEGDPDEDPCEITWESPAGFKGTWGDFSLSLSFPSGKPKVLTKLLNAAERLPAKLPELSEPWFRELIANFQDVYAPELDDEERVDYDVDASGKITDTCLRQRAGQGQIQLRQEDGDFYAQTWFAVPWDREHGFGIEWDEGLLKGLLK